MSDVRIVTPLSIPTPLGFIFGAQSKFKREFDAAAAALPIRKASLFTRAAYNAGLAQLSAVYQETYLEPGERIRISYITPRLENCDDAARTVEVAYWVFSSEFLYYASRIFERQPDKITRSNAPGKIASPQSLVNVSNKLLPQPISGYNESRRVFAGGKFSFVAPGGIFDRVDLDLNGSANSAIADFDLSGSENFSNHWVSHLDWRAAYGYSDLPSNATKLRSGTAVAQIFGISQPLGRSDIVMRFGASLEGGNRQTDLPEAVFAGTDTGHAAAKFYLGSSLNRNRHSWSASYGLQLGSNSSDATIDYVKQIIDARYRGRFLWREHRALRLEAQFNAGRIREINGPSTIVEHFFGGNEERPFINGDDWLINSNPLIRSFPQNALGSSGVGPPTGGTNFYSFNLTVSQPLWHYPAVPQEISGEPNIMDFVGGQLRTARRATFDSYLAEEPKFIEISSSLFEKPGQSPPPTPAGNLDELEHVLKPPTGEALSATLARIRSQMPPPPEPVLTAIDNFSDDAELGVDVIKESLDRITKARNKDSFRGAVKELSFGLLGSPALISRVVINLEELASALDEAGMTAQANEIDGKAKRLNAILQKVIPKVQQLVDFGAVDVAVFKTAVELLRSPTGSDSAAKVIDNIEKTVSKIKQQADKSTNIGRAAPLTNADILDATKLVAKLKKTGDPLADYLRSQFLSGTQQLLANQKPKEEVSAQLQSALLADFNRLIQGPSLFDSERFANIDLSDETAALASPSPTDRNLIILNRSLLAEAYPGIIAMSQVSELTDSLESYLKDSKAAMDSATTSKNPDNIRAAIHQMMVGFGDLAPAIATRIDREIRKLRQPLTAAGLGTAAAELASESATLQVFQQKTRNAYKAIKLTSPEQKTERDIAYAADAMDVIFRELNLIEVSPTIMFDAARIGPQRVAQGGRTRYGLGLGVRLTLVSLDFTAGYSFNLNRGLSERRGAFVLSMKISDLFR